MNGVTLSFSYDRLEKAARNPPETVGAAFERVIVIRLFSDRTIELKKNTIIYTVIVSRPQWFIQLLLRASSGACTNAVRM